MTLVFSLVATALLSMSHVTDDAASEIHKALRKTFRIKRKIKKMQVSCAIKVKIDLRHSIFTTSLNR